MMVFDINETMAFALAQLNQNPRDTVKHGMPSVKAPPAAPLAPEVLQWLRDLRSSSHETQFAALSEIGKRSSLRLDDRVTISVAEALANMTWQNQTSAIKFVLPNDPKLLGYLEQLAKRYADKPHHVVYMDATNKIKSIKAK